MPDATQPLIAAIVPAYNAAGTLGRCLSSLVAQPVRLTVIVVDDGSTDATAQEAGSRVVLLRHPARRGRVAARLTGLAYAREVLGAEWVTFVDADDCLAPAALSRALAAATEADVVQMSILRRGRRITLRTTPRHPERALQGVLTDERLFPVGLCGKLIRTAVFPAATHPLLTEDLSWGEDRLWCLALLGQHPRIALAPAARYIYNCADSASQTGVVSHLASMKRVHALKRAWAAAHGHAELLEAIDAELLRLLAYEVRMAINRGDLGSLQLESELQGEPWCLMSPRPDADRIAARERRSLRRIIKLWAKRLLFS